MFHPCLKSQPSELSTSPPQVKLCATGVWQTSCILCIFFGCSFVTLTEMGLSVT
jgi:hypothetical protein